MEVSIMTKAALSFIIAFIVSLLLFSAFFTRTTNSQTPTVVIPTGAPAIGFGG